MNLKDLLGKTLVSCELAGNDEIRFTTSEGERYKLYHHQDCCERVTVEDINGDLQDLVGAPLIMCEESSNQAYESCWSQTWTFYRLATVKGYVVIRWMGESNGYYSESVDFAECEPDWSVHYNSF